MNIEWHRLRSWNGSQNSAFEELCCQLAACEPVPSGAHFTRKAPPDAGVECLWALPSGDEWGWQAKFFDAPPNEQRWRQIEDSVEKALEKHPRLKRYTVCLPLDRQDPHLGDQKWFMDKWNERVQKWKEWAREKQRSVDFHYWGEHEIFTRLARDEHAGRYFFWFNKDYLGQEWFKRQIEKVIANAGPRYLPELNIDLPIARVFEGLGRTPDFYARLKNLLTSVKRTYGKAASPRIREAAATTYAQFQSALDSLLPIPLDLTEHTIPSIDFAKIAQLCLQADEGAWACIGELEQVAEKRRKQSTALPKATEQTAKDVYTTPEDFRDERHHLLNLTYALGDLQAFAESHEACLANTPALLVAGEGGTGKTHLLCDVAGHRVDRGLPTVVVLGEHFTQEEPWSQIIRLLGLPCKNEDEFLGALEAVAQLHGVRAFLLIDALNEGDGKRLWHKHLAGMLTSLRRYPWVALAVSVRTSYERLIIPEGLVPSCMTRVVHRGFADREYEATRVFFDHYHIERPSVPHLVPEFRNPLFLNIFCKGLANRGITRVPDGLEGITTIFDFFVDSVNDKLSHPEQLDFDQKAQLVQKGVDLLAHHMAESGKPWLPRDKAQVIVNSFLSREGYERSLFKGLLSESILSEDVFFLEGEQTPQEGVRFSYERLADHLVVKYLLDAHLAGTDPAASFASGQPLNQFVKDETTCWEYRSLIEAFSVQIPERIDKELVEIATHCAHYWPVQEAFIDSLLWRRPMTIGKAALAYINDRIIRSDEMHARLLDLLLTVACKPSHPLNADFLHRNLQRFKLADRDAWWSVFLHRQYGSQGAVDRLVDWAWSPEEKGHVEDEAMRLCGTALAWFLTTSNRFLRDRATKALVMLLQDRLRLLRRIIAEFLAVNDLYVLERLFAVAYGCAMRSQDRAGIASLARNVYEWVFRDSRPPPHILLRDYARGVIELALHNGSVQDIDASKIHPPYKSEWPTNIPTGEELRARYEPKDPSKDLGYLFIWHSVMGFGDFARYIIGTNGGSFEWSFRRLNEPRKPSRRELYEKFEESLTQRQRKAWTQYQTAYLSRQVFGDLKTLSMDGGHFHIPLWIGSNDPALTGEELEASLRATEQAFRKTLGKRKLQILEEAVLPYLNDQTDEFSFDLSLAQRWIFQRVIELGWTPELFGQFDSSVDREGRLPYKAERIGKKYQWIAYHEFLARVADTFEFRSSYGSGQPEPYNGPWQVSVRDIDPSFCLRFTKTQKFEHSTCWWAPITYTAWDAGDDASVWLQRTEDLPGIRSLLEIINPHDGSMWLLLDAFFRWVQPASSDDNLFLIPRRDFWYLVKAYLVKRSDLDNVFEWAKKQDFRGRWMPESHGFIQRFLGEYPRAAAFVEDDRADSDEEGWTQGRDKIIPKPVLVTSNHYSWGGGGYDCSIDDNIAINLPAKWLVEQMNLSWNRLEGCYFGTAGQLVAFDPSVREPGPGALLACKDSLLSFLHQNGYDIIWTILGEKNVLHIAGDWKGRLELSGVYRLANGAFEGGVTHRFKSSRGPTAGEGPM